MIDLRLGDCLQIMPTLSSASFDAIIADIPYGTTACKWDTVIPFAPMWAQLKRLAKPKAAIVLFGSQPFTSALVMSNAKMFRYEWIWDKHTPSGFLNCQKAPLKQHEIISVFSENGHTYNPQKERKEYDNAFRANRGDKTEMNDSSVYGDSIIKTQRGRSQYRFPKSIVLFSGGGAWKARANVHPTQKPVALLEYLVRTYTNEGDTVLDFTAGSGTLGVACVKTNRNAVLIEKELEYFEIMQLRIADAQLQMTMDLSR